MKLKILLKIVETVLGVSTKDDAPRADMYLPVRLLGMAIIFLAGGTACGIFAIIQPATWAMVCAPLGLLLGIGALLCWRNQTIHVISDTQFTYTTMFGNTRTYSFHEIEGLRQNADSMTLFVAGEKVHIESMAIISERLAQRINKALEKTTNT